MGEYMGLNLPDCYTSEDATAENKEVFEYYKKVMQNSSKTARGAILNIYGVTVWEEPLEEYEARMEALKND